MEIANLKPRLGSEFVREAFLRHFLSRKVDDEEESRKKRLLRAVIFFKEFTAFIGACLNGTLLRLEYCYAKNCWKCRFEEPIDEWLTEKESLIILAFAKPKLRAVFMTSDEKAPPMNEQLTNYLAGIPRLFIPLGEANIYSLALLKKMAPHLSSLTCSPEYLNHNLPRMKLEMCKVQCFGISKINLGPLFSKHQIRQIVLDFYNNLNDDRIVCGGRSLNPSVEELHVLTAKKFSRFFAKALAEASS
ncbi:hypothetical protein M3Y94_00017700 [Aphelenchoides besseyi]|nr:hypothetical protein M3Y94_00017700 [Aphelenchoides besseyi]